MFSDRETVGDFELMIFFLAATRDPVLARRPNQSRFSDIPASKSIDPWKDIIFQHKVIHFYV